VSWDYVIVLDYPNWPTVGKSCRWAPATPDCYKMIREQRLWGGGDIAETDAGIPQFKAKLTGLGWADYQTSTPSGFGASVEPNWSKIVVSGHSQGAGMALLIGKRHAVAGVVILSGGTDNSATAPWLTEASVTPPSLVYGLFHDADGMGEGKEILEQVETVLALENRGSFLIGTTDPSNCCSGALLHTDDPSFTCATMLQCDAHYASLDKKFTAAWTYMLTRQFNSLAADDDPAPAPDDPLDQDQEASVVSESSASGSRQRHRGVFASGSWVFALLALVLVLSKL
jgi:hypothetical protein